VREIGQRAGKIYVCLNVEYIPLFGEMVSRNNKYVVQLGYYTHSVVSAKTNGGAAACGSSPASSNKGEN
jgi:hypothetical protein